ncbi:MAG: type II secretion system F family protein [Opitutaceae bacterium]|nr:type II secretion system F family protein [Opitutaceae bacterium]
MPRYTYAAIDASTGRERTGELDRRDIATAIADLKERGLFPMSLIPVEEKTVDEPEMAPAKPARRSSGTFFRRFRGPPGAKVLAIFTRQLAALAGAGVPLVRSLDLLARQECNPVWREIIINLADAIRAGGTFSAGLKRHPEIFDRLYIGMIEAGEAGGGTELVLERLARHLEKTGRTRARVKSAMTYPIVIMAVAVAIVAGLMVFVVPRFEQIFAGVLRGAPLPALTQVVLRASRLVQEHWLVVLGAVVLVFAGGRWLRRTRAGARVCDRLLLRLPVLGGLLLKSAIARFSRTLGTMLAGGVPILQALQLTREASGNCVVAAGIDCVHRRVREGEGLARPLAATGIFPSVVTGMVEVGEETGTLPAMLARIADIYEEEVDNAVTGLTSLIEPVMIVLMAAVVGTIVIALFLPIIRIIQLLT